MGTSLFGASLTRQGIWECLIFVVPPPCPGINLIFLCVARRAGGVERGTLSCPGSSLGCPGAQSCSQSPWVTLRGDSDLPVLLFSCTKSCPQAQELVQVGSRWCHGWHRWKGMVQNAAGEEEEAGASSQGDGKCIPSLELLQKNLL